MKIVIYGLGIIGGSFAKAIKKYTDCCVTGINRSRKPLEDALACGAIDEIGNIQALRDADMLILGTFPEAMVKFIKENAELIPEKCIVIDSAGIKTDLCRQLSSLSAEYGFSFVGCHPMAGKEKNGFSASEADLFVGASCVIVPCNADKSAVEVVDKLMRKLGFGQIMYSTPEEHDRIISFTSQLPHVIACSYVMSPTCPKHKGFSAGSYRDVSRVANINEKLWAELFLENRVPLIEEIDILTDNINKIKSAIQNGDRQALEELLAKSRKIKEDMGE